MEHRQRSHERLVVAIMRKDVAIDRAEVVIFVQSVVDRSAQGKLRRVGLVGDRRVAGLVNVPNLRRATGS